MGKESFSYSCDCPYPGTGCKHTVAVLLDAAERLGWRQIKEADSARALPADDFLTAAEIRQQALEDRRKRSKSERFVPTLGDMLKGEHILGTRNGREYAVTLHDPAKGAGHCTCPS